MQLRYERQRRSSSEVMLQSRQPASLVPERFVEFVDLRECDKHIQMDMFSRKPNIQRARKSLTMKT